MEVVEADRKDEGWVERVVKDGERRRRMRRKECQEPLLMSCFFR